MAQAPMALAPGVVYRFNGSAKDCVSACKREPSAEIDVFVVEEVVFVESTDRGERLAAEQEEHACQPLWTDVDRAKRVVWMSNSQDRLQHNR
jgi:hypothetical protein